MAKINEKVIKYESAEGRETILGNIYKAEAILKNASKLLDVGEEIDTLSIIDAALDYLTPLCDVV